ncbi:MAG: fibrillin [Oscillatoriales cyanobacterium]|nr:MAG: fibrillin [Oscillatoriales cyanobacterium]
MLGKSELLSALAAQNRGIRASANDQAFILSLIVRLEERNPTPRPLEQPTKLAGNWRLLYTTSNALLGIERPPLIGLGEIYQCIRPNLQTIYNLAEINNNFGLLAGYVAVAAGLEAVSAVRVNVRFQKLVIGSQWLAGYRTIADWVDRADQGDSFRSLQFQVNSERQQGWLEVTYLDDDLRIGRGNEGSVFVLKRV